MGTVMDPVSPSACQIHHNHRDHWVTSIYHENNIYLCDSLGSERPDNSLITDGLKLQLSQLYGRLSAEIKIHIPQVMKQSNNTDYCICHFILC